MKLDTPWGNPDGIRAMGRGVLLVSTASHGGIFVPDDLLHAMPAALKCNFYGGGNWFEEDCEWALVCLAYPELFAAASWPCAAQTIQTYNYGGTYHSAAQWLASSAGDSFRARISPPADVQLSLHV